MRSCLLTLSKSTNAHRKKLFTRKNQHPINQSVNGALICLGFLHHKKNPKFLQAISEFFLTKLVILFQKQENSINIKTKAMFFSSNFRITSKAQI